ncbi:MAG: hypothetical protein J2P38_07685, partial [Candidatus Dormibacteraeota bacterium]|nr:hypothetical protein [Candidatus Dormibacteraeota bacterium]
REKSVFDDEYFYRRAGRLELVASTNPLLAYETGMEPMRRSRPPVAAAQLARLRQGRRDRSRAHDRPREAGGRRLAR